jgi:ATP-dependent Clp protease ATP-binding subunit ClpX
LLSILTKPKNALCKQYQKLFELEGVKLEFSEDALKEVAQKALERKTGARGLRAILEKSMMNIMYELPSMSGVSKCIITKDMIVNESDPLLVYEDQEETA